MHPLQQLAIQCHEANISWWQDADGNPGVSPIE